MMNAILKVKPSVNMTRTKLRLFGCGLWYKIIIGTINHKADAIAKQLRTTKVTREGFRSTIFGSRLLPNAAYDSKITEQPNIHSSSQGAKV